MRRAKRTLKVDTSELPGEAELLDAQMTYIAEKANISVDQLKQQAADIPDDSSEALAYLAEAAGLPTEEKDLEALASEAPTLYQLQKESIAQAANTSIEEVEDIISSLPTDLMTASGSGLDPHISPASADIQVPRIAEASGLSEEEIREIISRHTGGKVLGIFGEDTVNVLEVNIEIGQAMGLLGSEE